MRALEVGRTRGSSNTEYGCLARLNGRVKPIVSNGTPYGQNNGLIAGWAPVRPPPRRAPLRCPLRRQADVAALLVASMPPLTPASAAAA
jgi:hypothetical protein